MIIFSRFSHFSLPPPLPSTYILYNINDFLHSLSFNISHNKYTRKYMQTWTNLHTLTNLVKLFGCRLKIYEIFLHVSFQHFIKSLRSAHWVKNLVFFHFCWIRSISILLQVLGSLSTFCIANMTKIPNHYFLEILKIHFYYIFSFQKRKMCFCSKITGILWKYCLLNINNLANFQWNIRFDAAILWYFKNHADFWIRYLSGIRNLQTHLCPVWFDQLSDWFRKKESFKCCEMTTTIKLLDFVVNEMIRRIC